MILLNGLQGLTGRTAGELASLNCSLQAYPKSHRSETQQNITNMRDKQHIFGRQKRIEQNVLTKRNRFGFKSNLF